MTTLSQCQLETALDVLKALREVGPTADARFYGICYSLNEATDHHDLTVQFIMNEYAPLWDEYSGDVEYPVPGFDGMSEMTAYNTTDDMWDKNAEYGRARYRLVDHLIECIEKDLQKS